MSRFLLMLRNQIIILKMNKQLSQLKHLYVSYWILLMLLINTVCSMLHHLQTGHPRNLAGLLHRLSGYPRRTIGLHRRRGRRRSPTSTPYRCRHVLRWSSWLRWASETGNATSSCWSGMVPTCRGLYRSLLRTSTTGMSPGTECNWWPQIFCASSSVCFWLTGWCHHVHRLRSIAALHISLLYTDSQLWPYGDYNCFFLIFFIPSGVEIPMVKTKLKVKWKAEVVTCRR